MSTTRFLQNQKYQSCIDACNNCAESCEFCATECLREDVRCWQDVFSYAAIRPKYAGLHHSSCLQIAITQRMCARYVLISVTHVQKNVANMLATWNIVDYVLKLVQHVRLNAEKWLDKAINKVGRSYALIFLFFKGFYFCSLVIHVFHKHIIHVTVNVN
jgi:hypothetical protein